MEHNRIRIPMHIKDLIKPVLVFILLCSGIVILLLVCAWYFHGIEGEISLESDAFKLSDDIVCTCGRGDDQADVFALCEVRKHGVKVRHSGEGFLYRYRFTLTGENIVIHPIIYYERIDTDFRDEWTVCFYLKNVDGKWDATVNSFDGNKVVSTVVCTDIERNGIELKYMEEGHWLYKLSE